MGLEFSNLRAILCMDLDGTLIDLHEQAHPQDIQHLNDFSEDILPILTTGRSLPSARGVLNQNGILTQEPFPLPGVFLNGAVALLPSEVTLMVQYLESALLQNLLGLSETFSSTAFFFYQPNDVYLVNPTPIGRHLSKIHYLHAQECAPEKIPNQINKVMVIEEQAENIIPIREMTWNWPAEIATSLPNILEFGAPGITKGKTLKVLLDEMALGDVPVYIVGDGENDLTMKDRAKLFFVPDTAQPHVREQADVVISRERDGLITPILEHSLYS